ncbi:MAG: DUF72 domain-containing protein [Chloroflexi bacterium]|nr:DUF72 domain-containing protein [Chloroflexota bacterium]
MDLPVRTEVPVTIWVGTSGWAYPHWRGIFYPRDLKQGDWFTFYAKHFGSVEINTSFYRLPREHTFDRWREQAPVGFLYALKASRFLTHMKRLMDPQEALKVFFERATRLGETLGPILYQLPPHWGINLPRFQSFLAALPRGYVHVIEFRDPSWLVEEVFETMERHRVAHCVHDMPPLQVPLRVTAGSVYIRFHGNASHSGDYSLDQLKTWVGRIENWSSQGLEVYAYFNNDAGGYALTNARTLRNLLEVGRERD